ncbi:glutathione S-transferase family protein [Bradyrhizobium sp. LHD-71]|uniref:glutathione S-transferase family protein n=1 Tax=Bradyrhizobium sp. LHD-71 TaxID=3072141 RepID=UPI00280DD03F|nr:glutathione S-transferase family protein [Bradyrhizobium sp. LHD-71]MDQ8731566.1 glutathione S-transferase family protein [Bradyrhizobium sp. LHD-71]
MSALLKLISHKLCPYVQRAVIALSEKGVPFERVDIDLDAKPEWFGKISPLGKTPVLVVGDKAIFESAVILEYLEETQPGPLHPSDPLVRAEHRAWIEFNSAVLGDIWGLEIATDEATFRASAKQLEGRLASLEKRLVGPWFDGEKFSLVDAVFGPAFRYFDVFDEIGDFGIFAGKPKLVQWRKNLAARASIRSAVSADYPSLLRAFLKKKGAYLSQLEARKAA